MLEKRLRDHNESLALPLTIEEVMARASTDHLPSLDEGRADGGHRPNVRWLAVAAVLMLAVGAGALALWWLPGTSQPLATNAGFVSPEGLPELPGDLEDANWRQIQEPFPGLEEGERASALEVVESDGVAWAVGNVRNAEDRQSPSLSGVVWRSEDGERWSVVDVGANVVNPSTQDTELNNFYDVVATQDGSIWALGGETVLSDDGSGLPTGSIYRSHDGDAWERIAVPQLDGAEGTAARASAEGNEIVAIIDAWDRAQNRNIRSVIRTDGVDIAEVRSDAPEDLHAVLHDGELADVSGLEFDEAGFFSTEIVAGPDFFVATGGDLDAVVLEINEGESLPTVQPLLWSSTDAAEWSPLDVPDVDRPFLAEPRLFAHSEGVLAVVAWADEQTGEAGTSIFDIDEQQAVEYVGELPVAWLAGLVVLDGQLLVVGWEASVLLPESTEGQSVWVSQFGDG